MGKWDMWHSIVLARAAPCTHATLPYAASEVLDSRSRAVLSSAIRLHELDSSAVR
jgi:hypothetical protein